jgi:hypothetical protein
MTATSSVTLDANEDLGRLDAVLDLGNVRLKLADQEEWKGYDEARLDLMESEYRKFLALHLAFPGDDIVPCKLVDEIWHQHILDTAAYRADCALCLDCSRRNATGVGELVPRDGRGVGDAQPFVAALAHP